MELLNTLDTNQNTTVEIETSTPQVISTPTHTVKVPTKTNTPIVKSRKRASLKEFATKVHMRREQLAGFRAWLRTDQFHFDDEWQRLFQEYTNRKI